MDDKTLQSLCAAFRATPENQQLLRVLLEALVDRNDPSPVVEVLEVVPPEKIDDPDTRLLAAEALLASGDAERALGYLDDDRPTTRVARARALLALDRYDEGREEYEAAVTAEPAVESPDLASRLRATITRFPSGDDRRRLRVVSTDETYSEEIQRWLAPPEEPVTFRDVGGLEDVKEQIRKRIILPFQKPKLFARFKKRVGGGILLYGPPGCGKTLLARATAGEVDARFFNVQISDVLDMYIGESERKLHELFQKARAEAPAVLFFDEIEALGGKREYRREATAAKLVSQFLSELDGFQRDNSGVLVLGATNVPWAIDPAFRRPGRFDRVLFVPPPDRLARREILDLLLSARPVVADLDPSPFATATSGYSGADLFHLVETATEVAIEESIEAGEEVPIETRHLQLALRDVRPTTLEWLTTARNYARYANEGGQYNEVLDFLAQHGASK